MTNCAMTTAGKQICMRGCTLEGMLEQRLHLGEDASVPFALAWLRINELSVLTSAVRW
jgi:hypothetical protein